MTKGSLEVTVVLFAMARERAGRDRVTIHLGPGARVTDALRELASLHPALDDVIGRSRIAVNGEFVDPEHVLSGGDELALIPPVSGGR